MSLLRVLALRLIYTAFRILGAIFFLYDVEHDRHRVGGEIHRVGAHVGDVPGLIELLRGAHGAARGEAEARGRGLLQRWKW